MSNTEYSKLYFQDEILKVRIVESRFKTTITEHFVPSVLVGNTSVPIKIRFNEPILSPSVTQNGDLRILFSNKIT